MCRRKCGRCGLTCRSTGGATAGQPGRATALVHHRPHGLATLPRRPGYLYVRRQVKRSNCLAALAAVAPASTMPLAVRHSSAAALRQQERSGCARVLRRSRGAPQVRVRQGPLRVAHVGAAGCLAPSCRSATRKSIPTCSGCRTSGKLYLVHDAPHPQRPELPPNWSLNRTRNGMGPRGAAVHLAPRGPMPSRAG